MTMLTCYYVNATNHLQVARIANVPDWYYERVVFPGDRLLFEAPPRAEVEIYSGSATNVTLIKRIPSEQLQIIESPVMA